MKAKFTWWQIICGILEIIAIAAMILCIATDINDELFLPCALCCIVAANIINLVMNRRNGKNKK